MNASYNSKNSTGATFKLAEQDPNLQSVDSSEEEFDQVFSGMIDHTVPELLQKLIERGNESPKKFPIRIKSEKGLQKKSFNSRKAAHDSESNFDEEDFESMHPEWANTFNAGGDESSELLSFGGENLEKPSPQDIVDHSGSEKEEKINHVECPKCNGLSKHNQDRFAIYTQPHCGGCPDQNCGSDQNNMSPHCAGCELDNHGCGGRPRAYYEGDPKAKCTACDNTGEIVKRNNHCLSCKDNKCSGPDAKNPGHCKSCKDHNLPNDFHLPSIAFSESIIPQNPDTPEEDVYDDFERNEDDETMSFSDVGDGAPIRPKNLEHIAKEPARYEGQEESSRLNSPISLHKLMQQEEFAPKEKDEVIDNDEVTEDNKPLPVFKSEKHNPWCKCKGSGITSDPEEIAKINSSDEFKNGIANIKRTAHDEQDEMNKKQQFILDQYKCKEM